jgi:hypothetical protein
MELIPRNSGEGIARDMIEKLGWTVFNGKRWPPFAIA